MDRIIQYVVSCDALYGIIALAIFFIGAVAIEFVAYKIICEVLLYIYKIICKFCNTSKKYNDVRTKIGVKEFSFENDLHQQDTVLK